MVLEQGALSGKYNTQNPLPAESDRGRKYNPVLPQIENLTNAMKTIGEKYGASCSQIGIAWAIAKGVMPIIGATKPHHVLEAAEAAKHSHFTTPAFLKVLAEHDALLDEGFPIPDWTVEDHLQFMRDAGIEKSVLTLPAPQPYFGDAAETARVIRATNEAAAKLKAEHPDKFLFCAALPLPDVEAAMKERISSSDTSLSFFRIMQAMASSPYFSSGTPITWTSCTFYILINLSLMRSK